MAVVEVSEAGGNANATTSWVGGVLPKTADDIKLGEKSGSLTVTESVAWNSTEAVAGYKGTLKHNTIAIITLHGKNAAGYTWRWLGGTYTREGTSSSLVLEYSAGETFKAVMGGQVYGIFRMKSSLGNSNILDLESTLTANEVKHEGGKLNSHGFTWTLESVITASATLKTLNIENSTIVLVGTGTIVSMGGSNLTLVATGSTLEVTDTSASARVMKLGEKSWGTILFTATGGAKLKIEESFTCVQFGFIAGQNGTTKKVVFKEGITMTVSELNMKKGIFIGASLESSVAGKFFTIKSAVAGTVFETEGLSIQDSHATNGEFFVIANGTNVSGNEGWKFEARATHEHTLEAPQPQAITRVEEVSRTLSISQPQKATRSAATSRALSVAQSQTATHSQALARGLSASQAQKATRSEVLSRALSVAQAQTATRSEALARSFFVGQPQRATRAQTLARMLSASQAQSATRAAAIARTMSAPSLATATRTTSSTRTLNATTVATSLRESLAARTLAATQAQEATVIHGKAVSGVFAASQSQSATASASVGRSLSASQGHAPTLVRSLARTLSASETQGATSQAAGARSLTVAQHSSALVLRSPSTFLLALGGSSANLTRVLSRTLLASQRQSATVFGALAETGTPGRLASTISWKTLTSDVTTGVLSSTPSDIVITPSLLIESTVE